MTWLAGDLLPSLTGRWRIRRSIEDLRSASPVATLDGHADILPDGPWQAFYVEEGLLSLHGGPPVNARRTYYYRQQDSGLEIFFDAERARLFHRLVLSEDADGSLVAADLHLCGADRYEGLYRFGRGGSFSIEHAVTGPHKSYRSITRYEREGARRGPEISSV